MTPEDLDLVTASADVISADPDRFADRFYEVLFERLPEVRGLFPDDLREQKGKVVEEMGFLVAAAGDVERFVERARDLGRRHAGYGVTADHYEHVEVAMLSGLEHAAGDAWSDAHLVAWRRLYRLIAETMLDGAAGTLFAERR